VLFYIGQTGRYFQLNVILLCNKVKTLSHCGAGLGVSNESIAPAFRSYIGI